MRATPVSSLTLSVLLAMATLLLPLGLVHAQQRQQLQEDPSALANILSSDDSTANHHELGIDLRHRRHLYRAIEHFYASVVETNIQQNSNRRQRRRIQRRDLLNEPIGNIVPTPSKDGSGSSEAVSPTDETTVDTGVPTTPPTMEPTVPPTTTDPTTPPPVTTIPTTPPPVTTDPTTPPPVTTHPTTPPPVTTDPTTPPPVTTDPTTPPPVTTNPPVTTPDITTATSSRIRTTTTSSSSRGVHTNPPPPVTTTPKGVIKPSDTASSGSMSASNKAAITIGVVVSAIVVVGAIGVWVFRKWKLSPSRQFKSKIRTSTKMGGMVGGAGAGGAVIGGDNDYDAYTDIFRPQPHDSAVGAPVMASSMAPVSGAGSSPTHQQQALPQTQSQYELGMYEQQQQAQGQGQGHSPNHQHMSLSSAVTTSTTVPDYSQYRYATGYESGIPESILGNGGGYSPTGGYQERNEAPYSMFENHQPYHSEGSVTSNGRSTGQFLRELRE